MHVSPSGAAFNYGDAEEDTAGTMTPFPARPQLARCDNFDIIWGRFPSRTSPLYADPHAPCEMHVHAQLTCLLRAYLVPMLAVC